MAFVQICTEICNLKEGLYVLVSLLSMYCLFLLSKSIHLAELEGNVDATLISILLQISTLLFTDYMAIKIHHYTQYALDTLSYPKLVNVLWTHISMYNITLTTPQPQFSPMISPIRDHGLCCIDQTRPRAKLLTPLYQGAAKPHSEGLQLPT